MDRELRRELTELQQSWLEHLHGWEQSGLRLTAYARREGLDERRLCRFKRILRDKGVYREGEAVTRRFVRAEIVRSAEAGAACRIRLRNGCVVELSEAPSGSVTWIETEAVPDSSAAGVQDTSPDVASIVMPAGPLTRAKTSAAPSGSLASAS